MRMTGVFVALAGLIISLGSPSHAQGDGYSLELVEGNSRGNHRLDCTLIRPWDDEQGPGSQPYPVIGWANGWDQGDVLGATTTQGYLPGLIGWAQEGEYLVIAANAWSAREPDVVQCLYWLIDQGEDPSSEYFGVVDSDHVGLAGHSQGAGAVLEAGDRKQLRVPVVGIVAMNPYGPDWTSLGALTAPVLILGGSLDTTTPPDSYQAVWDDVLNHDQGGILAELVDGNHNSEAWGVDEDGNALPTSGAALHDFGRFQRPSAFFWASVLREDNSALRRLVRELDNSAWIVDDYFNADFHP